jgi:hypothetical protein
MSEQDIASLGLRVDSSQVDQASKSLNDLSKAAKTAESASAGVGDASVAAAEQFDRSAKRIINAAAHIAEVDPRLRVAAHTLGHLEFSPAAIGGFLAGAVAIAAFGKAAFDGAKQSDDLVRSIAATGNSAGVTADQLGLMAARISGIVGTEGNASHALAALASTGKVAADNLEHFAAVAVELERSVGTPVEETAKRFAELADEPTKAAAELQKSFNFLTPSIYDQSFARSRGRAHVSVLRP